MVALIADLLNEEVRPRVGLDEPPDADVRRGVQRGRIAGIDPSRQLQERGRDRGGLGEMERVAGVHPAAGEVELLALVGTGGDDRVVEVRGPVQRRGLTPVTVGGEEAQKDRNGR